MGVYECIHVYRVCTGMYMCIGMSGFVWVYMDVYMCIGMSIGVYRYIRIVERCLWVCTDVYMCIGMSMTVHGCVQMCTGLSMGVYECLYHVQESTGFLF